MSAREKLTNAESRAIITALFMILYFVTIWILALYAQEFFNQVFPIVTVFFANALGVFYGAKNGEKRIEQLLDYLPRLMASQIAGTVTETVVKALNDLRKQKIL